MNRYNNSFQIEKMQLRIIDIRIEYRIHIYIHQVLKILVVAARYRIHRLIREGHCIQESIQRTLRQFNKRILERILLRTTEHGMLNDMRYTGVVWRRCTEGYGKYFVVVVVGNYAYTCSRLIVTEHQTATVDIGQVLFIFQRICR